MISADLEAKVIAAVEERLDTADVSPRQTIGSWSIATETVRNVQSETSAVLVAVSVGTPQCVTYTSPAVSFNCSIAITTRLELDPSGTLMKSAADSITTLFSDWQSKTYQQAFEALDLDTLSVDEVSVTASASPSLDVNAATTTLSLPFTLSGSYRTPAPVVSPTLPSTTTAQADGDATQDVQPATTAQADGDQITLNN